ncbi:M3 family oligoendopeptidase [Paenibacillus sacheonensis]|uniref:M3 family oligoendopeptidase n=1 Tax=Paenibacillus sacheonensis TaxID=742054 RepID=A0A7X5C3Q3_9BACL|nr:M3 family oligoendopeptidase [Paenibacillus sacheonensis]MBM7566947.1 pepF/M3 family oligoendopeptidase [Paenibacillus sacheonensis]NBC71569.1 M3 family oligoendopeptidase [Paenibacillus sacheonensis]
MTNYPMTWDLDVIYEGGSNSAAFLAELAGMERDIESLTGELAALAAGAAPSAEQLTNWTASVQSILLRIRQSDSFVSCLQAQQMKDAAANGLNDRVKTMSAKFNAALTSFDEKLLRTDDASWQAWLQSAEAAPVAFVLNERREASKEKLPPEQEALAGELAVDGYHGWGDFYNTIVSRIRFDATEEDGTVKQLSAGQMFNRLSNSNRSVREAAFAEWERVWGEQADLCADTLNRISGFRLKLYDKRGWKSILKEPLEINRMSEATLNAMWSAVTEGKPKLVRYLERKAKLLGLKKLDWHDVAAPLGQTEKKVSYDEAAAFIKEQFGAFSPDLADFTEMAFKDAWIEAEDRPGKRPGGFCTAFPKSEQTRIFMTYSGTPDNVSTLAHELGHAYHQHVMNDLPPLAQEYAMNVAETASTFAEMIVADSALEAATERDEKLALLDEKLQNAVAFFMNIHARFLFETRFYEKRSAGMVSQEELNGLMEEAQREAFSGALGELHPHFWAAKLHFYLTDVPFYNFPYTFGYLFSGGIYAIAKKEGASFAERYVSLLRDTGLMTVEELGEKHLGVRLDQPDFWREAVALLLEDVDAFLALTEE